MSRSRARIFIGQLFNDYASSNVDNATPVQLIASLGQDVNLLNIFDNSSGSMGPVQIMIGPVGGEVPVLTVTPGCDKDFPCLLNKGMRVSLLSSGVTIVDGQIRINMYQ
jgi:hypothetical protein